MITLSLAKKYRPKTISEMVLPPSHSLRSISAFSENPYPSAWMFCGRSGLGKTSLAEIVAQNSTDTHSIRRFVGSDLDSHRVKEIEESVRHRPLWGQFYFFIVNEADEITRGGQVRLLSLLEDTNDCIWIFTSNEAQDTFESRFMSRVKCVHFTSQGLLAPGARWLMGIALREGLKMSIDEATKIMRDAKNNLRDALQTLEIQLLTVPPLGAFNRGKTALKPVENIIQGSACEV